MPAAAAAAAAAAGGDGPGDVAESTAQWTAFVDGLLRIDPSKRYSAHQALSRDIFEPDAVAERAAARRKKSVSRDASPTLLAELRQSALGISPADADRISEALSSPTRRRRQSVSREASPERLAEARRAVSSQPVTAGPAAAAASAAAGFVPSPPARDGLTAAPPSPELQRGTSMGGLIKKFAPLVSDMFGSTSARAAARVDSAAAAAAAAAATTVKPAALNRIAPPRLAAAGGEGGGAAAASPKPASPA